MSYHHVHQLSVELSIKFNMNVLQSAVGRSSLNLYLSSSRIISPPQKQDKCLFAIIVISTKPIIISEFFQRAKNPLIIKALNCQKAFDRCPPITSTKSFVSLKLDASKFIEPGEFDSMNPKSTWRICPSESMRIFALCLSFIYNI